AARRDVDERNQEKRELAIAEQTVIGHAVIRAALTRARVVMPRAIVEAYPEGARRLAHQHLDAEIGIAGNHNALILQELVGGQRRSGQKLVLEKSLHAGIEAVAVALRTGLIL